MGFDIALKIVQNKVNNSLNLLEELSRFYESVNFVKIRKSVEKEDLFLLQIIVPVGFFYYISINGFSTYHAGIYVELLSEKQLERFGTDYEIKTITKEELVLFPQIHTMINLLLEEKENRQGTRSFFVYLVT